jgi:hypothetical protein
LDKEDFEGMDIDDDILNRENDELSQSKPTPSAGQSFVFPSIDFGAQPASSGHPALRTEPSFQRQGSQETARERRFLADQRGPTRQTEHMSSPYDRVEKRGMDIFNSISRPERKFRRPSRTPDVDNRDKPEPSTILATLLDSVMRGASFALEVVFKSLNILKTPLSYAFAALLLAIMAIYIQRGVISAIYSVAQPICQVPILGSMGWAFCNGRSGAKGGAEMQQAGEQSKSGLEFEVLMDVQAKIGEVLVNSADHMSISQTLKRGEGAMKNLGALVKSSDLKSREALIIEFEEFLSLGAFATADYEAFHSGITRAVDNVYIITSMTQRELEGIQERDRSQGSLGKFISSMMGKRQTEADLRFRYLNHAEGVEREMGELLTRGEKLLAILQNMELRLDAIHHITLGERQLASIKRSELLQGLWAKLGGNKGKLDKNDRHIKLLAEVLTFRSIAYTYVAGAVGQLGEIKRGLEDLRKRISPTASYPEDGQLEKYLRHVIQGVARLEDARSQWRNGGYRVVDGSKDATQKITSQPKLKVIDIGI